MNKLQQLQKITTVVADTGDISSIRRFKPTDATTNPSLVLKAAQDSGNNDLILQSIDLAKTSNSIGDEFIHKCTENFTIKIGQQISEIVPGRVSTEVDARLSFDTQAMVKKAHHLIELYQRAGVSADRILIKLASTWEGIKAAQQLEKEGINCNLTLLFNFTQAVACADAGVTLISPFVGRIYDWHQAQSPALIIPAHSDPGVKSVQAIYQHYKQHGYSTIVMGASFRSVAQIEQLAGCDNLTISPELLQALEDDQGKLEQKLFNKMTDATKEPSHLAQSSFRWQLNNDPMATEKLAEGVRNFAIHQIELEKMVHRLASK